MRTISSLPLRSGLRAGVRRVVGLGAFFALIPAWIGLCIMAGVVVLVLYGVRKLVG